MNQNDATFSDRELAILQSLVARTHTDNAMTGRGNTRDMTGLLRKLNTLTDNEEANDE